MQYHIHIYNPIEEDDQKLISLLKKFGMQVVEWEMSPVGPHKLPQVCFLHEGPLTHHVVSVLWTSKSPILVHPLTDDELSDHTEGAVWFNKGATELNLEYFEKCSK